MCVTLELQVFVTSPELMKEVLVTSAKDYEKSEIRRNAIAKIVGGMNLLSAQGAASRRISSMLSFLVTIFHQRRSVKLSYCRT